MSNFENLERELQSLLSKAENSIRECSNATGERRKTLSTDIDSTLDQAQNVVRQMENALRDLQTHPNSASYRSRIRQYDSDIQRCRRTFLTAVPATGSAGVDSDRFFNTYQRAEAANQRLMNTERKAYESEEIGTAIMTDLHSQREKLEGVDDNLTSMDGTMDTVRGKLRRLGLRIATDKVILIVLIVIEVLIIFIMVFFKWIFTLIPTSG